MNSRNPAPKAECKMMNRIVLTLALGTSLLLSASLDVRAQSTKDAIDKQQAELQRQRQDLEKKAAELQRMQQELEAMRQQLQAQQAGRSLSMNLSGDVLFDYDKATLKPEAEEALKKVAVVLSQFPESMVTIEGYTDAKGGKSVNLPLSRERANAVKDWLVKNGNVKAGSMTARGFGEENPVAPNTNPDGSDNPAGRALNRRVSIIVEKPAAATP